MIMFPLTTAGLTLLLYSVEQRSLDHLLVSLCDSRASLDMDWC